MTTALEGGGQEGQWTWARYRAWMDARTDWLLPASEPLADLPAQEPIRSMAPAARKPAPPGARPQPGAPAAPKRPAAPPQKASQEASDGVLVIDEIDDDPAAILERMGRR